MSVTEVTVANAALFKLGEPPVIALTDNSERARILGARFAPVRDALMRAHRWHFALARMSLAASPDAPAWGYEFQYQAPADILQLVQVNDIEPVEGLEDYRVGSKGAYAYEGGMILTDYPAPLLIRYVRRIVDPTAWDVMFVEALSAKLAVECCEKITQSTGKKAGLINEFREAMFAARQANAIETATVARDDGSWVMSRL